MPVYTYVGNKHTGDGTSAFRVRDASSVVRDVAIGYAVDLAPSTYTALQALFNFSSGGTNMAPEASDDAPPSGGSGGSVGGGHLIEDEGSVLPQRSVIDFVGDGVSVSDNGTKTIVTITAAGGGTDPGGGGGGSVGDAKIINVPAQNLATAGTGAFDGQRLVVRVGSWPDQDEFTLFWNEASTKWVGEPMTVLTQNDTHGMDLNNRSLADLVQYSLFTAQLAYDRPYTYLNGAQSATASTLNVAINPAVGFRMPFANSGRVQILDNIINYTGLTSTSFTGCSLFAGTGGTLPDRCNVVGPATGGHGLVSAALTSVGALWTAGFRLQEHLTSFLTGSEDLKAMTIAPYWYQYDSADGQIQPDVVPPVGGLGFSHTLVSPAYAVQGQSAYQAKPSERAFYWHETGWQTWSASGTPSKEYLIPRLYGKMAAGALDSGEICDTCLRMRWVG